MKIKILLLLLIFLSVSELKAQEKRTFETGLYFNPTQLATIKTPTFGLKWSSLKKENKFFRSYVAFRNNFQGAGEFQSMSNYFFGSFGFEKRKNVSDKIEFINGWSFNISANQKSGKDFNGAKYDWISSGLGVSKVIGLNYLVSENVIINFEYLPQINFGYDNIGSSQESIYGAINLSFGCLRIGGALRF